MCFGERLKRSLRMARVTPRHLSAATRIHYTTIYRAMEINGTESHALTKANKHTLELALDKIDALVENGKLPFTGKLTTAEKAERLSQLIAY